MKPGRVNFFDGMRVSAEHMDHLQGSLHSAILDLRGVAGAGRVHDGFEVLSNGDGTVTVQPGLAFDFQRNRIVCDAPRVVTPRFDDGLAAAYVCAEYTSTSTGVVEGVPTLIWDGCRLVVRPDLPSPAENQVPLARVRQPSEDGGLEVETLPRDAPRPPPGHREGEAPTAPVAEERAAAAGERAAAADSTFSIAVEQGTLQLRAPDGGLTLADLAARIGGALVGTPPADEGAARVAIPMGSAAAPIGFLWRSLSCRGVSRLWWGAGADESPAPGTIVTLHAEATYGPDGLAQHALQTMVGAAVAASAAPPADVVPDSIARLPLAATSLPEGPDSGALRAVLEHLELRLWLTPDTTRGLDIKASIDWKGGRDERALRTLSESPRALAWEATLAWKALGRA